MKRIALVTGTNRGIGLEISRQLADKDVQVLMTARDEEKGRSAAKKLLANSENIVFHPLDVTAPDSIEAVSAFVRNEFGRLDVLVNNAGILIDRNIPGFELPLKTFRQTLETNLIGVLALCQAFIPLMEQNKYGRIVNVSSAMGALHGMGGGYPAYRISKTALNALTRILASELNGKNILVNTMCPGWVRTEMGGAGAPRTPEEGADTAVWLAMLPDGGPTGLFFRDRKQIPW